MEGSPDEEGKAAEDNPDEAGKAAEDKTEEDDGILLICIPALPRERPHVPGGALRECQDCRRPIWVAPTGMKMERERGAQLVCMECAQVRMKDDPEAKLQAPTPEQIEEVKKTLLWNQARKFRGDTGIV